MRARLVGLVALAGTLVFLVGFPVALVSLPGLPMPSWSDFSEALTQPDDGTVALQMLVVVAAVAYLSFVAALIIEVVAAARRVSIPRLPGLEWQRRGAAGLVAAIAMLFAAPVAATAAGSPVAMGDNGDHRDHHRQQRDDADRQQDDRDHQQQRREQATTSYVTQSGDSLWAIAEQHLGSGASDARIMKLVEQIVDLNRGKPQPDGGELDDSHWIQPGWKLELPGRPATPTSSIDVGDDGWRTVTVQNGDSLSKIAGEYLGDPNRWPELVEANPGAVSDPNLIYPGQRLTLPSNQADTPAQDDDTRHQDDDSTPRERGDQADPSTDRQKDQADPDRSGQPDATGPSDRDRVEKKNVDDDVVKSDNDEKNLEKTSGDNLVENENTDDSDQAGIPVATTAGVTALLAAGLLGLIATRRTLQQRKRRAGQTFPELDERPADVTRDLRRVESPEGVEIVDRALRGLMWACEQDEDRSLPVVRVGRLTSTQFELGLAETAELPAPWQSTEDSTVWVLPLDHDPVEVPDDVVAPYPSLVVIGSDDDGAQWFVDLEYASALGIAGDPGRAREVLAAIAIGLADSKWADDLQVTIVGAYPELEDVLQTGRIRYLPAAGDQLLEYLRKRAERDREMLATVGAHDLSHARVAHLAPGAWFPEIVLLAGEITDRQRTQLSELIDQMPRVAIAAVTEGEPVGEWALRLDEDGQAGELEPVGVRLTPQRIDKRTYLGLLEALMSADAEPEGEPDFAELRLDELADVTTAVTSRTTAGGGEGDEPTAERPDSTTTTTEHHDHDEDGHGGFDAVTVETTTTFPTLGGEHSSDEHDEPTADTTDAEEPAAEVPDGDEPEEEVAAETDVGGGADVRPLMRAPRLLLLGPLGVEDAQGPTPPSNRRAGLLEALIYLHLNPGVGRDRYMEDVWHGRDISEKTFWTANYRARAWLGRKAEDVDEWWFPYFDGDHEYGLDPDVGSDWADWQRLLPDGPAAAPTENLEQALGLVRGRPFAGAPRTRYDWADGVHQQMRIAITDTAAHLAHRMLMEGRWQAAEQAAVKGLEVAREMEQLHRLRIKAAHAAGNVDGVREAIDRLLILADDWGGDLEEETDTLLDELPPAEVPETARSAR